MVIKRRLIIWLLRAYIQKWGKVIVFYFFLGLATFFLLLLGFTYLVPKLAIFKKDTIGIVGSYTVDTIPDSILHDLSRGLTSVDDTEHVHPDLASSWDIQDDGKTYVFHLRHDVKFTDGTNFTSSDIIMHFSDVSVKTQDKYTIIFHLKDPYAPFLVSVSRPIFKKGFIGVGSYRIRDIKLNTSFIQTVTLELVKNTALAKTYQFYPSEDSLKIAFALGEITKMQDLHNIDFKSTTFNSFSNASVQRYTEYHQLVAVFYNYLDKDFSDKKLRDALSYALPNSFSEGERAHSPLSPRSWAYQEDNQHVQDLTHAKLLLEASGFTSSNAPTFTITALTKYKDIAQAVQKSWENVGVHTKIQYVESLPDRFQIYLGDFLLSRDPDQYSLWHSAEVNNITRYKNLRIDKLLEDGRKTIDSDKRTKIYADFQKYLMDDQPATFLYFPYLYTVTRK